MSTVSRFSFIRFIIPSPMQCQLELLGGQKGQNLVNVVNECPLSRDGQATLNGLDVLYSHCTLNNPLLCLMLFVLIFAET